MAKTHGMWRTRVYHCWTAMIARCHQPSTQNYKYYGGRGVKVCDEWRKDFMAFYKYMGDMPIDMSIDRIDPDGDYTPGNVRWATKAQQNANKRMRNRTGYVGVKATRNKFEARVIQDGIVYGAGTHDTAEEAGIAYDCAAIQIRGNNGGLNYL
jgi:hypothetical protein